MLTELKLTILCENRVVNPNLIAEQGLSILIETPQGKLLFDTGQTDTVVHNAKMLGIELNDVNKIVLSHGHFDMVGGLPYLLREIPKATIYCHPNIFHKKFKIKDKERVDIGIRWEKSDIEELGAQFLLKSKPKEIIPNVWISGEIPRLTDYETIDETYQEQVLESYIHDEIHDDISLIIKTEHGLIILMGCGHAGPVNTVKHAMRLTNENMIHLVMGGMHLQTASDDKISHIVDHLVDLQPDFIAPLHCCGFRCINKLFNQLHEKIKLMNVGDRYSIGSLQ
ncbi:MAG: MBL fold metallo-hydrolase [bacterium]|nr:MAG: MBL fold metallo-hydrolase [bacterium]